MEGYVNNTDGSMIRLLNSWLKEKTDNFIVYYPSVVVNRVVYRGNL